MGKRRKSGHRLFWRITGALWIMLAAALCGIISSEEMPSSDSLDSLMGTFGSIETVLNGKSGRSWNIVLEDGTVLKASRTAGFDPNEFKERVQTGDLLGFRVSEGWIWEICDETGSPIHSAERSREAYMSNRDTGIWMILLCSAVGVLCVLYGLGERRRRTVNRRDS